MNKTVAAEDLAHGDRFIDPEEHEATVQRVQRIDHERCRISSDRGVAVVPLRQRFRLA